MPELSQFTFDESPVNVAIDQIIATLRAATDNAGKVVFQSVERGIPLSPVPNDKCPAIRIWEEKAPQVQNTEQFYIKERRPKLLFFIFMFQNKQDGDGNWYDMQAQRNRLVKFFFDSLQLPAGDNSSRGMSPDYDFWNFKEPKNGETEISIDVEHTQAFKKFGDMEPVLPPRYVTRIDIDLSVFNLRSPLEIPADTVQKTIAMEALV